MIKRLLRFTILFSLSLVINQQLWKNIYANPVFTTYLYTASFLGIFELILKPILKLLLLPVNILTLGLIRPVLSLLGLYLATFLIDGLTINNIFFSSFNYQGFVIPNLTFTGFWAYLVTSVTISLLFHFFKSIFSTKKPK